MFWSISISSGFIWMSLLVTLSTSFSWTPATVPTGHARYRTCHLPVAQASNDPHEGDSSDTSNDTKRTVEDDTSRRFKYKVNALLGAFDPPIEEQDTEQHSGNILNAMLTFPTQYSFHVVGKGDANVFADKVTNIIAASSTDVSVTITPRGTKFTKVTCQATVESAIMVAQIYEQLAQMEESIMQF